MGRRVLLSLAAAGALLLACGREADPPGEAPLGQVQSSLAWSEVATITPPDMVAARRFGATVLAPPGDPRVFVRDGRNAVVYVFTPKADGSFGFESQLARPGTKPLTGPIGLAAGDLLADGPPTTSNAISDLLVFRRDAAGWSLVQEVASPISRQSLGWSMAFDGQRLAVGATDDTGNRSGGVRILERVGGAWTLAQELAPPPEAVGMVAEYGRFVAFGEDTLAVTSSSEDGRKGALYMHPRSPGGTYGAPQRIALGDAQTTYGEICFLGDALLLSTLSGVRVFRKGTTGWAQVTTLDGPTGFGPTLRCDGKRAALVVRGVGARIWAPQGASFVDAQIPLPDLSLLDFALRGNLFFAGSGQKVTVYAYAALQGEACTSAGDCASGFCADGVCCDRACEGGPGDCQACSAAAGAAADGTCGPVTAARSCRAARGSCDVEERCDGVSTSCPVDGVVANGAACENGGTCSSGECLRASTEREPTPDTETVPSSPPAAGAEGGCAVARAPSPMSFTLVLGALATSLAWRRARRQRRAPKTGATSLAGQTVTSSACSPPPRSTPRSGIMSS